MHQVFDADWEVWQEDISKFYKSNYLNESMLHKSKRLISSVMIKSKTVDSVAQYNDFPIMNIEVENILQKEQKIVHYVPEPPNPLSYDEIKQLYIFKKFSNRYQFLWMLITDNQHPARLQFEKIFEQQKSRNINYTFDNIITSKQYKRIQSLTKQGLQVKLLFDYDSYYRAFGNKSEIIQKNQNILEVYVEASHSNSSHRLIPSKKIKSVNNLTEFIRDRVMDQVQKSKKDVPYYNFVHFDSSPQLFTRRTIIQDCLVSRTQEQDRQNIEEFCKMIKKKFNSNQSTQLISALKKGQINSQRQRNRIESKYKNYKEIHRQFEQCFISFIQNYHPVYEQKQDIQKKVYNWIITMYCQQSLVYKLTNNTIRYSLNKEKVKPISTMIKYLYDAIRYHFTKRFREIKYRMVYRGGRASIHQQNNFKKGKYLWNLGFLSTTRSQKAAKNFKKTNTNQFNSQQAIMMIIQIPENAIRNQEIQNHEGFWALDKIPEIKDRVLQHQQQVLFNPLNIFQIKQWDSQKNQLHLLYAPHLELMSKKKRGQKLSEQQQKLIKSLMKLNDKDYDKGMKYLSEGNPNGAIRYYQNSQEQGENLSYNQKSVYYESLKNTGDIQKINQIAKKQIKKYQKQIQQEQKVQKFQQSLIEVSITNLQIFEAADQYEKAYETGEKLLQTVKSPVQTQILDPSYSLTEAKTLIQIAKTRLNVNMTLQSIQIVSQSLKLLDYLYNIQFCVKLFDLGNKIKAIPFVNLNKYERLKKIMQENKIFSLDKEVQKGRVLKELSLLKKQGAYGRDTQLFVSNKIQETYKLSHEKIEGILKNYLKNRDARNQFQQMARCMAQCYWQFLFAQVNSNLSENQLIDAKQKYKSCRKELLLYKNFYKQQLQIQEKAYKVLYDNMYKTSLEVQPCLLSFLKFYQRYETLMNLQAENQGYTSQVIKVTQKHGELLFEYGQIYEKNIEDKRTSTQSERKGLMKIKQAKKKLQETEEKMNKKKVIFTHQRYQIQKSLTNYHKNQFIGSQQQRKTAMGKQPRKPPSIKQKHESYHQLLQILRQSRQIYQRDKSYSQSYFNVLDLTQSISISNNSSCIDISGQSYRSRLQRCQPQFEVVRKMIQQQNKQKVYNRNLKMAHLYLVMGQNQFRLGLMNKSFQFLSKSRKCLKKIFKIDDLESMQINPGQIDKRKIVYGNRTKIGCLKLQAHLICFYGNNEKKKRCLRNIQNVKLFYDKYMDDPLSQAQLYQCAGILYGNLPNIVKEVSYLQKLKQNLEQSLKIRELLLGSQRKQNARICTIMMEIFLNTKIQPYKNYGKRYYEKGNQIYGKLDLKEDPSMIIFKTVHNISWLSSQKRTIDACHEFLRGFQEHEMANNKIINVDIIKQYRIGVKLLQIEEKRFVKQIVQILKYMIRHLQFLKKFVQESYDKEVFDQSSFNVLQMERLTKNHLVKILKKNPQIL